MTAGFNSFGGPYHRFTPATREQLSNATFFHGQVPVSPARGSYQFSNRAVTANPRFASLQNRQFFQHQAASNFRAPANNFGTQGNTRGVAPNMAGYAGRANYAGRVNDTAPQRNTTSGWQRFGDPGNANAYRQNFAAPQEHSGWHSFGQPQQPAPAYNGARTYGSQPGATRSYGSGSFGSYASRPQGFSAPSPQGFSGARPNYSAPHYNAPSQHYSEPHYSAPSYRGGGGGGSHTSGGGGGHGGGGGGHSSSGGHHGR